MTSSISRRTFLRGATLLGVASAGGGLVTGGQPVWLRTAAAGDPVVDVVRDARMVWRRPPPDWQSAPFLGNAVLTASVLVGHRGDPAVVRSGSTHTLTFALGDAHGPWQGPIADLDLHLAGEPTAVDWVLDPYRAELSGTVTTSRGSLAFSALVHRQRGVLLVSLTPSAAERADAWAVRPGVGASEVGWRQRLIGDRRLLVAATGPTAAAAAGAARAALAEDPDALVAGHREWWDRYYRSSFVSVPDKRLQRFYWIQLYKAATVTGPDAANVGAQPLLRAANHPDLGLADPAGDGAMVSSIAGLFAAIPGTGSKAGGSGNPVAAWGLPDLWDSYRYSGDDNLLRDRLHPQLRSVVGFYSNFLTEGEDGRLHVPVTHLPGYGDVADSTYDLSLLRWAAARLLDSTRRLGLAEPWAEQSRDLLHRLAPYHTDDSGVMIGAGVRLADSHPSASHLLWLHPLTERASPDRADPALMRRSYDHWAGMRQAWQGGTYVNAASLATVLRAPEDALEHLTHFVNGREAADTQLTANTLYRNGSIAEYGAPLAAARAMLDMLLRTENQVIDVFAGTPAAWPDVSVAGLRAPGFVVDASRSAGRTDWIRVHSGGEQTLLLRPGIAGDIEVRDERGGRLDWSLRGDGTVSVGLRDGGTAVITRRGSAPEPTIRDVAADATAEPWGMPG